MFVEDATAPDAGSDTVSGLLGDGRGDLAISSLAREEEMWTRPRGGQPMMPDQTAG